MGLDLQGTSFLIRMHNKHGSFFNTLTLGRQEVHIPKLPIDIMLGHNGYVKEKYCDSLFKLYFGATNIDSMDISDYEGANIIHDLNRPLVGSYEQYDTVFDGGTVEHVYDIVQAFKNISSLCKVGGQILHILPANNQCGHGFYQFSPDLFHSLYSIENGYKDTEVYIGDTANPNHFVEIPKVREIRDDIKYDKPLYVMVRTIKCREDFSHDRVYQTDYENVWRDNVQ